MLKPTKDITGILKRERLELFERSNLALRKTIAKRLDRLDASQNERRLQSGGGNLRTLHSGRGLVAA